MNEERQNLIKFIKQTFEMSENTALMIALNFEPMVLCRNEFFLKEGSVCSEYLFLEKGFIRAFTFDTEGNEVTTSFYEQNSIVFEVASYLKRLPSQETFQAITDCFGWKGNYNVLQGLFHFIPEFREFARITLLNGYIDLKERTLSMINLTAEMRYEELLKSKKGIVQHAAVKHIASYLGITDTSLSRIRKEIASK
jgi:CRP-like cAMP-binding protein